MFAVISDATISISGLVTRICCGQILISDVGLLPEMLGPLKCHQHIGGPCRVPPRSPGEHVLSRTDRQLLEY